MMKKETKLKVHPMKSFIRVLHHPLKPSGMAPTSP